MEFEFSDRCKELRERLLGFMEDHVYPSEHAYEEQLAESGNPHFHPPVMEELKERARALGLWNLFLPHGTPRRLRTRAVEPRLCPARRGHGTKPHRLRGAQL